MGIGPWWTVGDRGEYEIVAAAMNATLRYERPVLEQFRDLLQPGSDTSLMQAQDDTIFQVNPKPPRYDSARIAKNWFGIGGNPVWSGPCDVSPVELHEVMRAARARLADLLLNGARECRILGSCGFERFEVWITWAPGGYEGKTVTMWVFAPHTVTSRTEYRAEEARKGEPGAWQGGEEPVPWTDNPATPGEGKVMWARLTKGREPGMGQLGPDSMEDPNGPESGGEVWFWAGPKRTKGDSD